MYIHSPCGYYLYTGFDYTDFKMDYHEFASPVDLDVHLFQTQICIKNTDVLLK